MTKDKIMYYSKYCKNCDKVIKILSRSSVKDYIHFLHIDKRTKNQKNIYTKKKIMQTSLKTNQKSHTHARTPRAGRRPQHAIIKTR